MYTYSSLFGKTNLAVGKKKHLKFSKLYMLINLSSHLIYAGGVVHVENLKHVNDIEVARYKAIGATYAARGYLSSI